MYSSGGCVLCSGWLRASYLQIAIHCVICSQAVGCVAVQSGRSVGRANGEWFKLISEALDRHHQILLSLCFSMNWLCHGWGVVSSQVNNGEILVNYCSAQHLDDLGDLGACVCACVCLDWPLMCAQIVKSKASIRELL